MGTRRCKTWQVIACNAIPAKGSAATKEEAANTGREDRIGHTRTFIVCPFPPWSLFSESSLLDMREVLDVLRSEVVNLESLKVEVPKLKVLKLEALTSCSLTILTGESMAGKGPRMTGAGRLLEALKVWILRL
jgi:hypothetical protein